MNLELNGRDASMRKASRTEHEGERVKHREYESVMVNASHPDRISFIFPLQTQFNRRLAPRNLPHILCFSALLMQRKRHPVMFCQSGTIKSPAVSASIFTDASCNEFLQRVNYPINTRETRHVFFLRKKKRAPFEGSLGMCIVGRPCFVKDENRNADATDPCIAAKHETTFFHFSCLHRVVLGYEEGPSLAQSTPNERQRMVN